MHKSLVLGLLLYRIFLVLYFAGIKIVSLGNHKAKLWLRGRKDFPAIDYRNTTYQVVWMHCASLGEFEQGRPLLEKLRLSHPSVKIVLTFFSSSGYETGKKFEGADHIYYLPEDSPGNAQKFIERVNPMLVLWIKYEYWFYYLSWLRKKGIPVLMISAVYRKNMAFFKWYGALWKETLGAFTHFFVQNQSSKQLLSMLVGNSKITNSGDTRFDRVITIAERSESIAGIGEFCNNSRVVVAGSTWEDDEAELVHYVKNRPEIRFIIAPHEIDKENLSDVKKQFPGSIFYSEWILRLENSEGTEPAGNCLIIDNIGMLSRLYRYGDVCFVGGGFGYDGLHNILEAAVYGKPVIFGPQYEKNFEAVDMIKSTGAISIRNALELEKVLDRLLNDELELRNRSKAARNYVYRHSGATNKILQFIHKNRLLTS